MSAKPAAVAAPGSNPVEKATRGETLPTPAREARKIGPAKESGSPPIRKGEAPAPKKRKNVAVAGVADAPCEGAKVESPAKAKPAVKTVKAPLAESNQAAGEKLAGDGKRAPKPKEAPPGKRAPKQTLGAVMAEPSWEWNWDAAVCDPHFGPGEAKALADRGVARFDLKTEKAQCRLCELAADCPALVPLWLASLDGYAGPRGELAPLVAGRAPLRVVGSLFAKLSLPPEEILARPDVSLGFVCENWAALGPTVEAFAALKAAGFAASAPDPATAKKTRAARVAAAYSRVAGERPDFLGKLVELAEPEARRKHETKIRGYSQAQIDWLEEIAAKTGHKIRHAANGGECVIPGVGKVDGYCIETNTIYEYHGGYWHGDPKKFPADDIHPIVKKTYGQLYTETLAREENIKRLGYNLTVRWEK